MVVFCRPFSVVVGTATFIKGFLKNYPMTLLKEKIVLITGAGSGLGKQLAIEIGKKGSILVLWDIDGVEVAKTAQAIKDHGGKARCYQCDVSNKEKVYQVASEVKKDVGEVDVLINNAGVVSGKPFMECSDDENRKTMEVNTLAHFWMVKSFLPGMVERKKGHVVTISSAAGLVGVHALADYSASKFAVVGFTEALRMELKQKGLRRVKTTTVCPYYIDTGMFEGVKTRFPFLLPILDEGRVVKKIISAVEGNKEMVVLPKFINIVFLGRLLPSSWFDRITDFLGISNSMDDFKGRRK